MKHTIAFLFALLLAAPAFAHEEHHPTKSDEPPINYSEWENRKGENCCNQYDCSPVKDDDVQESPAFKVRIEGKWCPVQPWHFLKKGNAPDWARNHACVRKDTAYYDMDMGTRGMSSVPSTDPCARLLCFQPRPQI